jgi:type I restriction enzyme R subunit
MEFMQSQNFEQLRPYWPELAELAGHAEKYIFDDPQSALVKLRCFAEILVGVIYREYQLPSQATDKFVDRLQATVFVSSVDSAILELLHTIRKIGNSAVHEGKTPKGDILWLLKEVHTLSYWLLLTTKKIEKSDVKQFKSPIKTALVLTPTKDPEHQERLKQALTELDAAKTAEEIAVRENARLKHKLSQVEQAEFKQASDVAKSSLELNEAETRRRLIDTELHSRGWHIDLVYGKNTEQVSREEEVDGQPTATGIGYSDYVLWDDNGKPLAVIEAKRTRESAEKGRHQATLYADSLEKKYGQRPIVFYTNGYDIYICDDAQGYSPRKLYSYYSKESLQYLIRQRSERKSLLKTEIKTEIAGRDYQIEAITRICEQFEKKRRKALVVQATGTGKTRVSIALTKRMIDAGWAKRVLFLCDRKELRKQAGKAYNEFLSEPVYIVGKSNKKDLAHARIYIATYPGMMSIMEEFDPGFFDLIIADESHRSIYNVFGDVFKYFDALQLGLTATPVEMVSRSTTELFGCEYKMPTANYPLEQAVADKNLVPFKVVSHTTQFLRDGIQAKSLTDEQIAAMEDQGLDPNDLDFHAKEIDKAVFNKDTNRTILRNLMENGLRMSDGQTLGKSMIFARNIQHAELLANLFSEMYPEYGGNFCRVIHSKFERAEEMIDDFKLNDGSSKQVTIAVSVDMLDTGIDVPEVLNLVFAKPVKSKVKFWQMVGRGTRLCKNLFGVGKDKSKFLIFDHWANFEYFELEHEEEEQRQSKSLTQKLFEARVQFASTALKRGEMNQFEKMIMLIKQDIDALDDKCIAIKDNWKIKHEFGTLPVLTQFAPVTLTTLLEKIAPLMQWRNIQGQGEALAWDIDIVNAQQAALSMPAQRDLTKANILLKVEKLSMHLNQVRQKAPMIRDVQKDEFWQLMQFEALEKARTELRDVIHLRDKGTAPPPEPIPIFDIPENKEMIKSDERTTNIRTVDYEIYRQEVEKTLAPLFNQDPVLQKIRAGESISESELDQLNALVHTQNAKINLYLLKEFYPDSAIGVDQLLRTIIGLDAQAVDGKFQTFVQQHHINLNSLQQRFLALLKSEICRKGQIKIDQLYAQPFISLHQDGIDGLFKDEQAQLIADFVVGFTIELGTKMPQVQVSASV